MKNELNAVYNFFTILSDVLGLNKAALLIGSDNDTILRPHCMKGFDETSLMQLRVKRSAVSFPNKKNFLGSPAQLPFASLFSSRDYGVIENLLVLPIYCGQKLNGLLFIADNPYLTIPPAEMDMIMRPVQDLLRQIIENHLELCQIPSALESVNVKDIKRSGDLQVQMVNNRANGWFIDFSYRECVAYLLKEFPGLLPEAAYLDMRLRLLNNLQLYIRAFFSSPGHCYIWLQDAAVRDLDSLISLCAIELSQSMISSNEYAENIAKSMRKLSMGVFLDNIQATATS